METVQQETKRKKRNPVFLVLLALIIIGGGWFGYIKVNVLHHEETDDAQVSADISPVIPRVLVIYWK